MRLANLDSHIQIKDMSHLARVGLYFLLLIFTIVYQIRTPYFINLNFLIPIYIFLTLSLGVNFILSVINLRKKHLLEQSLTYLLPLDVVIVSALLYFAGLQSSIYLFFYLYLIFISSLSSQLKGAIAMASFCSFCFSVILFLDGDVATNTKIFLFLINNISFFVVAVMGGVLSQRLETLGEEVVVKDKNLRELQNVNQLIVDNIKSGLITLDSQDCIIQFNKETQKLLGPLALGSHFLELLPELKAYVDSSSISSLKNSRIFEIVRMHNTADKTFQKNFEVLISRIETEGVLRGSIVLLQDVTNRKKQEEQLKTQEKLAAVGQLAAGIAHEIRNPLASMSGSIQLLAKSFETTDEDQKKLIAITLKETDRLNLLISEFLEFVRPHIPLEDKIDLSKLIKECVDMIQLNQHIQQPEYVLRLQPAVLILGNRDKLKQIILNILINGCHAMEKTLHPVFKIQLEENAVVSFEDNGVGMNEETKKKIFEPFFTTKAKGTGLGLALVHKIVELHNAHIEVDSVLNKGTIFRIRFAQQLR